MMKKLVLFISFIWIFTSTVYAGSRCQKTSNWVRDINNPVITAVAPITDLTDPSVIYDESDSKFKMWMSCADDSDPDEKAYICYSESDDVTASSWSAMIIVFSPSVVETWDDNKVESPAVIKEGSTYKMWYAGEGDEVGQEGVQSLGYATSSDGITWTRLPVGQAPLAFPWNLEGMVLRPSWPPGDAAIVSDPAVVKKDGTYYVYYSALGAANDVHISMATSPDGITWTREASNPVLSPTVPWEDGGPGSIVEDVAQPFVEWDGREFIMWYGSFNGLGFLAYTGIGYASSSDGVIWTKGVYNPIFLPDLTVAGEDIGISAGPFIITIGRVKHFFYCSIGSPAEMTISHATCRLSKCGKYANTMLDLQ
jgi:predicted GH43/DUF377 family glycosyl hydrolase